MDYTGINQLLFWLYSNPEFDFHRFMCSVFSSHSNSMTVMNWGKILTLLFSIWRLSLHHFVFSCSHMWLMVVLCMLTAFLLRCTWVLLCTDMAAEVCSLFCSQFCFLTKSTRTAGSWTAADVFTWKQRRRRLSPNTHARSRSVTLCVASINLLLSLLWSLFRITVRTVWWTRRWVGLAIPWKLLSSSSPSLLFAAIKRAGSRAGETVC